MLSETVRAGGEQPIRFHKKNIAYFREVALQLWYQRQVSPFKILLITSSIMNEGKSYVSSCLAEALSLHFDNVLLARYTGGQEEGGIALNDQGEEVIRRDGRPIFLQSSSRGISHVTLFSERGLQNTKWLLDHFGDFLRRVENRFDLILLDFPSLNDEDFPFELLPHIEKILLVVRANYTPKGTVVESLKLLDRYRDRLVGIVLNKRKEYIPKAFLSVFFRR